MPLVWEWMSQTADAKVRQELVKYKIRRTFQCLVQDVYILIFFIPFFWWLSSQALFTQIKAEGGKHRSPFNHLKVKFQMSQMCDFYFASREIKVKCRFTETRTNSYVDITTVVKWPSVFLLLLQQPIEFSLAFTPQFLFQTTLRKVQIAVKISITEIHFLKYCIIELDWCDFLYLLQDHLLSEVST